MNKGRFLLKLARDTIKAALDHRPLPQNTVDDPVLSRPCGAFVTLHKGGQLRGCIGSLIGEKASLYYHSRNGYRSCL
ncbi:hypothetical protein BLFGPEAP_02479 [Candidatus Methanoperedenaceae archaeon GB50]|nr:hypothetical protein BLFGPEAP_02479 [Candidatus Methanoperedenaceae archaeon GB50]